MSSILTVTLCEHLAQLMYEFIVEIIPRLYQKTLPILVLDDFHLPEEFEASTRGQSFLCQHFFRKSWNLFYLHKKS